MKTALQFYEQKYPKHTRILKAWVIELMEEYATQRVADIVTGNIGLKMIDNVPDILKELKKRMPDHVTLEDCKADDEAREERAEDYCTCNYQQPHTYGGESVQHCVNCHKWIKPIID